MGTFSGGKTLSFPFLPPFSMGVNSKQTEFTLLEANHSFKNRPHFRSRAVTIYQFIGATIYCIMEICYNLQQSKGRTLDFICRMHTKSNLLSTLCSASEDWPHGRKEYLSSEQQGIIHFHLPSLLIKNADTLDIFNIL